MKKATKLYISGPVTGFEDGNLPAFTAAAGRLEDVGYSTVLPHDLVDEDATWDEAMKTCIPALLGCDGVAVLPGWDESKGATMEVELAHGLNMPTYGVEDWCCTEAKEEEEQ